MSWIQRSIMRLHECSQSDARYTEAGLSFRFGSLSKVTEDDIAEEYKWVQYYKSIGQMDVLEELAQAQGV